MRLPTWDELIPEQLDVLEHPLDLPLFVAGPPGSGKTVLAVRRSEAAAIDGNTVALVTYNRMLRRLADLLGQGGMVSRTMHKFAYHDYRDRAGTAPGTRPTGTYHYDWDRMVEHLRENPNGQRKWDHVVVDEGQDLEEGFFQYLAEHATSVLTVFADEDQALGDRRTTLSQIRRAANLPAPILLSENHRNSPEIALLAEHFHTGILPAAMTRRPLGGQKPRLLGKTINEALEFIATWYENRGGTVGVIVNRNPTGADLMRELQARLSGRRVDFYEGRAGNEDGISLLAEGVTILNKESVKGQEFDTVFILELDHFIPCANDVMKRAMYMMCARARDYLFLLHGSTLSRAALACLPGPVVLERG